MTSFIDLGSSPDPLGDDFEVPPSSMRPVTRRMARNYQAHEQNSSLLPPSSTPLRPRSIGKSPRKQTFELDVGNEQSPQLLRVTVEADDDRSARGGINRRLFTSSPSRSISRRRDTITTMTTTVPLKGLSDDEGRDLGNASTPRKRGRPLGSRNGTPNPRGKKRAGTPLRKNSRATRPRGEAESEATLPSDVLSEMDMNAAAEMTPKPKPKARKTPKKSGTTAIPSSKATARKRGRPRKALAPQEVAFLTSEAEIPDALPNQDAPALSDAPSEGGPDMIEMEQISANETRQSVDTGPISSPTPNVVIQGLADLTERGSSPSNGSAPEAIEPMSESIHEARAEQDDDAPIYDDYLAEPHTDLESEADRLDSVAYSGQDNLTHASDFSMIAIDTLPSFQASFQGNLSGIGEESGHFEDAGDETNMIINQTLASLRRSTQSEGHEGQAYQPHVEADAEEAVVEDEAQEEVEDEESPASKMLHSADLRSSPQSWSRSPRRQKAVPLSRQVFANKTAAMNTPTHENSWSSIPESVLHAATPGRLPRKPASANFAIMEPDMYEDSFSEIPEEVLEAATPRPPTRLAPALDGEPSSEPPASDREMPSENRSTNFGSSRLPTPDDTNSSTLDSKNAQDEEMQAAIAETSEAHHGSDLNIPSSPPLLRQYPTVNVEAEAMQPEHEMEGTPSPYSSSEHLATTSGTPSQPSGLQPPMTSQRPSLSPIVRAGRTLQNIISDRSSPEGHESLGSPFRGSVHGDSRQSSIAKSPTRDLHDPAPLTKPQSLFHPITSLAHSIGASFRSSQKQSPAPISAAMSNIEDPFGPDIMDYSPAKSQRSTAPSTDNTEKTLRSPQNKATPPIPSSTRAAPRSAESEEINLEESSPATQRSRRLSESQQRASVNSSIFGTRGSTDNRLVDFGVADEDDGEKTQDGPEWDDHTDIEQRAGGFGDDRFGEIADRSRDMTPETQEQEDDDLDLWDVEASRPTPRSTKALRAEVRARRENEVLPQPVVQQATVIEAPRRSKIPSPWRRSTRRLIYQDEVKSPSQIEMEQSPPPEAEELPPNIETSSVQEGLQEQSSLMAHHVELPIERAQGTAVEPSVMEEYSMVTHQIKQSQAVQDPDLTQEKPTPVKKSFFGNFDFMSFFSSPAPLPKLQPPKVSTNSPTALDAVGKPTRLQAPSSAEKSLPEEPRSALRATGLFPPIPQKSFNPSPERRSDLFSPGSTLRSVDTVGQTYEDSPSTPERLAFPSIPQKRNFTPLSSQSRNTASLFTPSRQGSTAGDARTPSPTRSSLLEPEGNANSSMASDGPSFEQLPPREKPSTWDRTLSPTKSCLRSPLKPKTPGRVVEFSGTSLNPTVLGQERAERQAERALAVSTGGGNTNRSLFAQAPALSMVAEDKENTPSPPKSPEHRAQPLMNQGYQPSASKALPATSLLSHTVWTKAHWVRLDELLQLRRKDPFRFQLLHPESIPRYNKALREQSAGQHRHPLEGKEVTAGKDARLLLEGWHLEVAEAFRQEVGGWDAPTLAKRLFALIVGEERRRNGVVGKRKV